MLLNRCTKQIRLKVICSLNVIFYCIWFRCFRRWNDALDWQRKTVFAERKPCMLSMCVKHACILTCNFCEGRIGQVCFQVAEQGLICHRATLRHQWPRCSRQERPALKLLSWDQFGLRICHLIGYGFINIQWASRLMDYVTHSFQGLSFSSVTRPRK